MKTRRTFEVLDPVMNAWTDVKSTLAIFDTLLVHNCLTEAVAETMYRHLETDTAAIDRAFDEAWKQLFEAKVKADV